MSDAKSAILQKIRSASVPVVEAHRLSTKPSTRSREEIVDQFVEYASEYKATVTRCSEASLPEVLAGRIAARKVHRGLIPGDLPDYWLTNPGRFQKDELLSIEEIDFFDAVITGCRVAIAETGTFVLDSGPGQGRRVISLIPDIHFCVVFEDQVVDTVPEAVEILQESVSAGLPLTWISGPSATSDIELNRVEGVHGPRQLEILVVSR